ncbi:hypothetical protein I4F81_000614 [Pyropia yezoensis]|uniref:Uncharacterized protein n=1 Tax=Pyropia yezoensis TaxID=2788 RepID=A0ACC3BJ71_PYRYE|nr:hypothetical protein I4F81_000614 [Neopyropia yezoensis]
MSASVLATVKGVVPPPRRRSSAPVGMGRPRPVTSSSVGVSIPVQEAAIPVAYNLPPLAGAGGPPTRALHHFVVTRLRLSSGGPAGMPAPLDEVEVPGAALAAGGVLNAPGCSPLTVSLPSLTGWTVELGGEEPRLVVTTPTGRYYLVGRPAAAYVAVHGRSRARRRYELLVRAVALATHLPPADATYAKVVRQLGRRAAGMRAYTEADVLAERSFLLAQGWALDDPALRCSLFAQELARRGREISGVVAPAGGRATSPVSQPGSPPPACPPLGTGSSGPAGQAADPAHPKKRKRTVSLKGPVGDRPGGVAAKRRATAGVASSSKASPSGAAAASPSDADVAVGPRCACAGAPGGCGGSAPAAAGSKYASDACGMARARQRVTEMAAAGVDVDSFVRVHVEPLSRQPCL